MANSARSIECRAVINGFGSCAEHKRLAREGRTACLALWITKYVGPLNETDVVGPEEGLADVEASRGALSPEGHSVLGRWECAQPNRPNDELTKQEVKIRSMISTPRTS